MIKQLMNLAVIALISVLVSPAAFAHVAGGALVDGSKHAVGASYDKCVTVADGLSKSTCHTVKPSQPAPVAKPKPVSKVISLSGDALFETDSAELSGEGKAALDDFVYRANALKVFSISVVGHADSRGAEEYNLGLSLRRAAAVKSYIISKGMDAAKIFATGKGELDPVASNDTEQGRAQNRRVDISVTGMSQ